MNGVHEFYIKQQMKIILNSLLEEWNLDIQSLKDRLNALDFNTFADEILLERAFVHHYGYTMHRSKRKKIESCC